MKIDKKFILIIIVLVLLIGAKVLISKDNKKSNQNNQTPAQRSATLYPTEKDAQEHSLSQ